MQLNTNTALFSLFFSLIEGFIQACEGDVKRLKCGKLDLRPDEVEPVSNNNVLFFLLVLLGSNKRFLHILVSRLSSLYNTLNTKLFNQNKVIESLLTNKITKQKANNQAITNEYVNHCQFYIN